MTARRAAIGDLRERLTRPASATTPIEFAEAIDALVPWVGGLFDGLNLLGDERCDPSGVTASVDVLLDLRDRVAAIPRRRPQLAVWDPFVALLDDLEALAAAELDASLAADPDAAMEFEAIGQRSLDAAAAHIAVFNDRVGWWGIEHTIRLPDSIVASAAVAYEATGAQGILDLDQRGMALYERITEKPTGPRGVGVGLLLDIGLVDRAFDETRFFAIARLVYQRLDANRAAFLRLVDDPEWREDLLAARRLFYESQLEAETVLRELAGERRIEAGAAIALGGKLTERVASALLAFALSADPRDRVRRSRDYTSYLQAARQAGLEAVLAGFDERVRRAHGHTDFVVGDDHVLLGRERALMSDEELVDVVLSCVESCAAMFAAIDCVLMDAGHSAASDRVSDLPSDVLLAVLLAASGLEIKRLELRADRLDVSSTSMGRQLANPMMIVASLVPYISPAVPRMTLRVKRSDGTTVTDAALDPLRRYQRETGLAKDVAFVECLGRSRINGQPVLSRRHTRFLLVSYLQPSVDAALDEVETRTALTLASARHLGDRELAEGLLAYLAMKRAQATGESVSPRTRADFLRLARYVERPPGPWNTGGRGLVAA